MKRRITRRTPKASATPLELFVSDELPASVVAEPAGRYDRRSLSRPDDAALIGAAIPGATAQSAVAVATITRLAKDVLEGAFLPLWVRGEVTGFKAHRNGHWYFTLRDESSQLRCVIWSRDQRGIPAPPDDGMQVSALGRLTVYAARGEMQLTITSMEAVGDGLWRKAFEIARARLQADGLLDPARRRVLPRYPRCVAVVTSPDGAALQDIVSVIRRRCPTVHIVVIAAKVQGDGAPEELCAALDRLARWRGADLVIIGRGGGGREDLWAFNDERVARAVAACPIPTISAVGHEVDFTLCDLVADLRAPTPSAAAEHAVPVLEDERAALLTLAGVLRTALTRRASLARERLGLEARHLALVSSRLAERRRSRLEMAAGRLHALSPVATLGRGFAIARAADGSPLARARDFLSGMPFELLLRDGRVQARAESVSPDVSE